MHTLLNRGWDDRLGLMGMRLFFLHTESISALQVDLGPGFVTHRVLLGDGGDLNLLILNLGHGTIVLLGLI